MMNDETQPADRADALVLFGLMGDLGENKLLPAIYELARTGQLQMPVIGVGRSEHTDDDLRSALRSSVSDPDPAVIDAIDLRYLSGDAGAITTSEALADELQGSELPVIYAALPPALFGELARCIAASALPSGSRLVVEKPFGHDTASARQLFEDITDHIPAEQLRLVDHFLAKAEVENILMLRFRNPVMERLLDADPVSSVSIDMLEDFGADGRGSFYESVGAIADVLQNHLLQLLATVIMDEPRDSTPDAIHRARAEALRHVLSISRSDVIRGQYEGYRSLDGVAGDSNIETFVAARFVVDLPRWRGVPFTIRTGKALSRTTTSVTFTFDPIAALPVSDQSRPPKLPNRLIVTIKPESEVQLELHLLDGDGVSMTSTLATAEAPNSHGRLGDYAVMLKSALDGRDDHFAQIEDVVAAWQIVEPLLDRRTPLMSYEAGSLGPDVRSLHRAPSDSGR